MKSFGGARPFIFVNPKHIKEARKWLAKHQRPDGCVRSVGKLFHNGMKVSAPPPEEALPDANANVFSVQGGVSDDVSLTAYIAAAMLELDANVEARPIPPSSLG